jgi:hypothetical protein
MCALGEEFLRVASSRFGAGQQYVKLSHGKAMNDCSEDSDGCSCAGQKCKCAEDGLPLGGV